jgi:hypothetical protein
MQSTLITTKLMAVDKVKNKRMHGWSMHEVYVRFGLASCNARGAEHRLRQRISMLRGSWTNKKITGR